MEKKSIRFISILILLVACFFPYSIIVGDKAISFGIYDVIYEMIVYQKNNVFSLDNIMPALGYVIIWLCIFLSSIKALINVLSEKNDTYCSDIKRVLFWNVVLLFWNPVLLSRSHDYNVSIPFIGSGISVICGTAAWFMNDSDQTGNRQVRLLHFLFIIGMSFPLVVRSFTPDGSETVITSGYTLGQLVTFCYSNLLFQPLSHSTAWSYGTGLLLGSLVIFSVVLNLGCIFGFKGKRFNFKYGLLGICLMLLCTLALYIPLVGYDKCTANTWGIVILIWGLFVLILKKKVKD